MSTLEGIFQAIAFLPAAREFLISPEVKFFFSTLLTNGRGLEHSFGR